MKCVKCGNALEEGARFCGACGTQQPGAIIPQAAVRTGAKTLFQGSAPVIPPKAVTPSAPAAAPPRPSAATPGPAVPDKRAPVSQAMGYAATMAPGSVEMKAVAPQPVPSTTQPRAATTPVSQLPPPAVDTDLTGKLLNKRHP